MSKVYRSYNSEVWCQNDANLLTLGPSRPADAPFRRARCQNAKCCETGSFEGHYIAAGWGGAGCSNCKPGSIQYVCQYIYIYTVIHDVILIVLEHSVLTVFDDMLY